MKQLGGAADWLLRYDARLRDRQREQQSERPVTLLLASSGDGYAQSGGNTTETREVVEITIVRRRALPSRFVPLFAPELGPPPRIFVRERALPPAPAIALLPPATAEEPEVEWDLAPEPSLPSPSVILDGPTDAMALPPYIFEYEEMRSLVSLTPGDAMVVASDTEPMFPRTPAPEPHVIVVMVEPSARSPSVRPSEVSWTSDVNLATRGLTPPPLPRLPPPILELTPPRWPISDPVIPASVVEAATRRAALLPVELANPWKDETPRALLPASTTAVAPASEPAPAKRRTLTTRLLRGAALTFLAACAGAGIRSARLHAHPVDLPTSTTTTTAATPAVVATTTAAARAAVAAPSEGEIEIDIVGKSPIHVDGMLRGNGPHLVLKIAPGYHMIRAGADRTELAEVRAGKTARVDFARAP